MPGWLFALCIIGAVLIGLFLIAIVVCLFMLVREDIREQVAEARDIENRAKALQEERRQRMVAAESRWNYRVFHTGVDRISGETITRSSVLDTPQAKELWEKIESDFANSKG
jgi:hypothetical protein